MIFCRDKKRVDQTRIFLRAKIAGAPTKEARRLAGLPAKLNITNFMNHAVTQKILEEIYKEPEFRDDGIVRRLKDMWNHKRIKAVKVSGPSMVDAVNIEEDDTDMWKYSMDKVLTLRGYLKNGKDVEDAGVIEASGGITFNVLQVTDEKKEQKTAA